MDFAVFFGSRHPVVRGPPLSSLSTTAARSASAFMQRPQATVSRPWSRSTRESANTSAASTRVSPGAAAAPRSWLCVHVRSLPQTDRLPGHRVVASFVRAPEGNGCSERFIRTLKENLLWVRYFATVEELRLALLEFKRVYNEKWLLSSDTTIRRQTRCAVASGRSCPRRPDHPPNQCPETQGFTG